MIGQHIGQIPLGLKFCAVVFEGAVKIRTPMSAAESQELLKSPGAGMIRVLSATVPFAETPRGIPGVLQKFRQEGLIGVHPFGSMLDSADPGEGIQSAGTAEVAHPLVVGQDQQDSRLHENMLSEVTWR